MELIITNLPPGSTSLETALAAARSARNISTRRGRQDHRDRQRVEREARKHRRKIERETELFLRWRVRIQIAPESRPRVPRRIRRDAERAAAKGIFGIIGSTDARGRDGLYAVFFRITPRGFSSQSGRKWRSGEAARAGLYVTRPGALEDGEEGWWSNVADDREELVAFLRSSEQVECSDRANANVYVSEIVALPAELSARARRRAVRRICEFFDVLGLPYVAAMHLPDAAGDQRNYHCHILYSLRPAARIAPYAWQFELRKIADITTPEGIRARRLKVVEAINDILCEAGIEKRYTHLSNAARGMKKRPQPKVGQQQTWVGRRIDGLEVREAALEAALSQCERIRSLLEGGRAAMDDVKRGVVHALREYRAPPVAAPILAAAVRRGLAGRAGTVARLRTRASTALDDLTPRVSARRESVPLREAEVRLSRLLRAGQVLDELAGNVSDRLEQQLRVSRHASRSLVELGASVARLMAEDRARADRIAHLRRLRDSVAEAAASVGFLLGFEYRVKERLKVLTFYLSKAASNGGELLHLFRAVQQRQLTTRRNHLGKRSSCDSGRAILRQQKGEVARALTQRRSEVTQTVSDELKALRPAVAARLVSNRPQLGDPLRPRHELRPAAESVSRPPDPARAAAVKAYVDFIRSGAAELRRESGIDVVDVELLPDEWQACARAFDLEPEVRRAIDAVATRRREAETALTSVEQQTAESHSGQRSQRARSISTEPDAGRAGVGSSDLPENPRSRKAQRRTMTAMITASVSSSLRPFSAVAPISLTPRISTAAVARSINSPLLHASESGGGRPASHHDPADGQKVISAGASTEYRSECNGR